MRRRSRHFAAMRWCGGFGQSRGDHQSGKWNRHASDASMWPDLPEAAATNPAVAKMIHRRSASAGVDGNYRPVADMYRPMVAPPLDQALAAYALFRYASSKDV